MKKKLLKIVLIGRTNAGKSSLLNKIIGETVSISNKKINTTNELIKGIVNFNNIQIILYDTPGLNFLKTRDNKHKIIKANLWQGIEHSNLILYLLDSKIIKLNDLEENLKILFKLNKKIILVFNKIDLIEKNKLLPIINQLNEKFTIDSFFNVSAKYNIGLRDLFKYLKKFAKFQSWEFKDNEITNKDDIFITNECTRNAILTFLHKELPYNIVVTNHIYKILNNGDIKIKQNIKIANERYKKIILGKNGSKIKEIRISSQKQISKILKSKVHLYLEIIK